MIDSRAQHVVYESSCVDMRIVHAFSVGAARARAASKGHYLPPRWPHDQAAMRDHVERETRCDGESDRDPLHRPRACRGANCVVPYLDVSGMVGAVIGLSKLGESGVRGFADRCSVEAFAARMFGVLLTTPSTGGPAV